MGHRRVLAGLALILLISTSLSAMDGMKIGADGTPAISAISAPHVTATVDDILLSASVDMGTSVSGLPVPAFIDQNDNANSAYTIGSFDLVLQGGAEKIMGRLHLNDTPIDWGLKGKLALAYTYWQTQQGGGEPGNYFADNGFGSQVYIHSGDMIDISGFWWALSPEFTAHMAMNEYIKFGASLGFSMYGYMGMNIDDPWSGYSTPISNSTYVWHSAFLQKYLPGLGLGLDFSLSAELTPPKSDSRILVEAGITGPSWIFGIGYEYPFSQAAVKTEEVEKPAENSNGIKTGAGENSMDSGGADAAAPSSWTFGTDKLIINLEAGYQYVLMSNLNNGMYTMNKIFKANPSYSNVSYSQMNSGISIMAGADVKANGFYFGPEAGYLFCIDANRKFDLNGSPHNIDIYAGLIPLEAEAGYEIKPGDVIKGYDLPFVVDVSAGLGYGFAEVSRNAKVTGDPAYGNYDINSNYYGGSGLCDLDLKIKYPDKGHKGLSYGFDLGYRYCIVDKLTADKDYSVTTSNGSTITINKGAVYGVGTTGETTMDYRGFIISAFAGYNF